MSAFRSSQFRTIYIDQKGSVLSDLQRLTTAFSVRVTYLVMICIAWSTVYLSGRPFSNGEILLSSFQHFSACECVNK